MDEILERAHLAEADRIMDDGIRRIDRQKQIVQELRLGGRDIREAERLLALLQKSLTNAGLSKLHPARVIPRTRGVFDHFVGAAEAGWMRREP
jgi:hypothetical protein